MSDDILEITFFKKIGDEIRVFENSNDCIGQIIVKGSDLNNCKIVMEKILKNIRIELC